MKRFVCYFLSLILCFSSFGANAYVCLEHGQKNTQQAQSLEANDEMTACHEQSDQHQQLADVQSENQSDCCDHECNTCLHFTAVVILNKFQANEDQSTIIDLSTRNFSNLIQVIPTPPPIA